MHYTVTEEFRALARDLGDLYQRRKEIAKEVLYKEDRLKQLGVYIEFADNLEGDYGDQE